MKYAYSLAAATAMAASAALFAPTASSAMPMGAPGAAPATDAMIIQAQQSRRYVRSHRSPRVVHRYHHNRNWNRGAVIGGAAALGILGAAAAASAAPYYYGGGYACYIEQRPVHDAWGRYLGVQNVQVCP